MSKKLNISFLVDGELEHSAIVKRNEKCDVLYSAWVKHAEAEAGSFILTTKRGKQVCADLTVGEYAPPSKKGLKICVTAVREIDVRVVGVTIKLKMTVHSMQTVDEVANDIKEKIGVLKSRPARLMCGDNELRPEEALLAQIGEGTVPIFLNLELNITTVDVSSMEFYPVLRDEDGELLLTGDLLEESRQAVVSPEEPLAVPAFQRETSIRTFTVFASDLCSKLMEPSDEKQRVVTHETGRKASPEQPIAELVTVNQLVHDSCPVVRSENQMNIEVDNLIKKKKTQVKVWPTAKISTLLTKSQRAYIDDKVVDAGKTFLDAGLAEGSVVTVSKNVTVIVVDSACNEHVMSIDAHINVFDLHELVSEFEENEHFRIYFNGRKLTYDDRNLYEQGVRSRSILKVMFATRDIELWIKGGARVPLSKVRKGTRYQEFLSLARECLQRDLPNDTVFKCECGRILSNEGPYRTRFPLKCCPKVKPVFLVKIPVEQRIRSRSVDSTFRAPRSRELTTILESIKTLSHPKTENHRQKAEAALIKGCLQLEDARQIKITKDDKLFLRLNHDGKEIKWPVMCERPVYEVMRDVDRMTDRRAIDLAILTNRKYVRMNIRDRPAMTVREAGFKSFDAVTPVYPTFEDSVTQTPHESHEASVQWSSFFKEAVTAHPHPLPNSAHVQARPLQQLRFEVKNPHGAWEAVEVTVSADATVGEAIATTRPLLRRLHIGADAVMITEWIRHGAAGAEGRALRCFDPEEKKVLWIDNKSGQEVPFSSSTFFIKRFLLPSSPLPTAPRLLPNIVILTEAEWLQVSGERQLQRSPAAEQNDPSFVTLLWGVRTETGQHFWWLRGGYVNSATGEVHESERDLPAGESRRFFYLLRPYDRIPRIAVPSGKYLMVLNRAGTAVRVERGQLKAEGPKGQPDLLEWEMPRYISKFDENLNAAARE